MSKFIKLYMSHTQYEAAELLRPNVSRCRSEKHVHYNPNEVYVRGNIVIPYRGLVESDDDSGESTCYGDNTEPGIYNTSELLNVGNDCTIQVDSMEQDYWSDEETVVNRCDCGLAPFDAQTQEPLLDYDEGLYDETGIKYYYYSDGNDFYFAINLDKDAVVASSEFVCNIYGNDYTVFPKVVQKTILTVDDYNNGTTGTTVNAILVTDEEEEDSEFITTTARTVSISTTQTARIISPSILENQSQLFTEIKLDGVVTTESQVALSDGTHTIEYKLNKKNIPEYGFALCTALSNVTISPKVKTIDPTAFEFCDLLDTDEKTIKRVCTITEGDIKYEPVIIEAEFDDENIYTGPTSMGVFYFGEGDSGGVDPKKSSESGESSSPAHYFAVYNGTTGLHTCSSDGGGK